MASHMDRSVGGCGNEYGEAVLVQVCDFGIPWQLGLEPTLRRG